MSIICFKTKSWDSNGIGWSGNCFFQCFDLLVLHFCPFLSHSRFRFDFPLLFFFFAEFDLLGSFIIILDLELDLILLIWLGFVGYQFHFAMLRF
jgi:hypothetical protein